MVTDNHLVDCAPFVDFFRPTINRVAVGSNFSSLLEQEVSQAPPRNTKLLNEWHSITAHHFFPALNHSLVGFQQQHVATHLAQLVQVQQQERKLEEEARRLSDTTTSVAKFLGEERLKRLLPLTRCATEEELPSIWSKLTNVKKSQRLALLQGEINDLKDKYKAYHLDFIAMQAQLAAVISLNWSLVLQDAIETGAAIKQQGPHQQSCYEYIDFLQEEFVDMIHKKQQWVIRLYSTAKTLPGILRLSPPGCVPQQNRRRPRWICDYHTWLGSTRRQCNLDTHSTDQILREILLADPELVGPAYLMKIDISDGWLGMVFPTLPGQEKLVALPLHSHGDLRRTKRLTNQAAAPPDPKQLMSTCFSTTYFIGVCQQGDDPHHRHVGGTVLRALDDHYQERAPSSSATCNRHSRRDKEDAVLSGRRECIKQYKTSSGWQGSNILSRPTRMAERVPLLASTKVPRTDHNCDDAKDHWSPHPVALVRHKWTQDIIIGNLVTDTNPCVTITN
eukprot:jgi/Psemu1/22723/gm1.22723_g